MCQWTLLFGLSGKLYTYQTNRPKHTWEKFKLTMYEKFLAKSSWLYLSINNILLSCLLLAAYALPSREALSLGDRVIIYLARCADTNSEVRKLSAQVSIRHCWIWSCYLKLFTSHIGQLLFFSRISELWSTKIVSSDLIRYSINSSVLLSLCPVLQIQILLWILNHLIVLCPHLRMSLLYWEV